MRRRGRTPKRGATAAVAEGAIRGTNPRRERLLTAAAIIGPAIACFGLYLCTMAPTVVEDDSSEFVAAIHVLGIPHPTGYPLYMLLGKLFETLLPFGGAAYRVNLLSAVCAAVMVGLLGLLTFKITGSRPGAVLAALVAGLNEPTWEHAAIAEVYTLHGLLVMLVLSAFWRWHRVRTWRAVSWLWAAAGLGLAHHRTILFFAAPAILIATMWQRPFGLRGLLKAIAAGIAPLALYAYLPLRAMANPWLNWGNPRTWSNFWFHVMARTYAPLPFGRGLSGALAEFSDFMGEVAREISWPGVAVSVAGAVVLLRRKPLFGSAVAASMVGVLIFNSTYGLPRQWQFHVPTFIVLGLWLGVALAAGFEWVRKRWASSAAVKRAALATTCGIVLALLPVFMTVSNYRPCNRRGQWEPENWARKAIAELEPNAVLAATGDTRTFATWYVQAVHGLRRGMLRC